MSRWITYAVSKWANR